MFTIIGADGKEYGPVTSANITDWIAAGRANLQTKARRDGETEWKSLGDFAEFSAPPLLANDATSSIPAAAHVPAYAPAPVASTPANAVAIAAALNGSNISFDLFSCISRSFALWKAHLLPLAGITFLSLLIQMIASMIPLLGFFSSLLLGGVFTGGLYYYYLGKIRGESREVGDIFAGFTKAFAPLMLTQLLMTALILLVMLPFFGPLFIVLFKWMLQGAPTPTDIPPLGGLAIVGIILGSIVLCYLSIAWIFGFILVIDQGLGPWTALEVSRRVITRHWFSIFFLMLCASILALLGLIGLIVGVFFTLPLLYGSILYAYEDLCRRPSA